MPLVSLLPSWDQIFGLDKTGQLDLSSETSQDSINGKSFVLTCSDFTLTDDGFYAGYYLAKPNHHHFPKLAYN